MNIAQQILGGSVHGTLSSISGVSFTASTGETFNGFVEDIPMLPDPEDIARAKLPTYTKIHGPTGCVANPRAVRSFAENETGRSHRVLRYEQTVGDQISWVWTCEAQRL